MKRIDYAPALTFACQLALSLPLLIRPIQGIRVRAHSEVGGVQYTNCKTRIMVRTAYQGRC